MNKIKWSDKVTNEKVLESMSEKRTLLNISCIGKPIELDIF